MKVNARDILLSVRDCLVALEVAKRVALLKTISQLIISQLNIKTLNQSKLQEQKYLKNHSISLKTYIRMRENNCLKS